MKLIEQRLSKNIVQQSGLDEQKTFITPTKVIDSWKDALSLRKETADTEGFRNPQIGAVDRALSHWTCSENIGTIVMQQEQARRKDIPKSSTHGTGE